MFLQSKIRTDDAQNDDEVDMIIISIKVATGNLVGRGIETNDLCAYIRQKF